MAIIRYLHIVADCTSQHVAFASLILNGVCSSVLHLIHFELVTILRLSCVLWTRAALSPFVCSFVRLFVCFVLLCFELRVTSNCFGIFYLTLALHDVCAHDTVSLRYCFVSLAHLFIRNEFKVKCCVWNRIKKRSSSEAHENEMNFAWMCADVCERVCLRVCECVYRVVVGADLIRARDIVWMERMTSEHSKL